MNVITLEFLEQDAIRLLWLVQREATEGKIYNDYWWQLAQRIQQGVTEDAQPIETQKPPT
jgi:hypothetical protein